MTAPGPHHHRPASWRARRLDPNRSLGLRLTIGAAAAFLVLVPFSLLVLLVLDAWAPLRHLDQAVTDALHRYALGHPAWVDLMRVWTTVFAPMTLRVAVAGLAIWLWRRDARRLAGWAVATMVAGGLLGLLLKLLVGRHRPELLDPVARATGYSFPSGHALNSTLAAGVFLLVLLPFVRRRPAARWGLWVAAVLVAGLTGVSRIALGVHWTSDVVGGWLLGIGVLAATTAAFASWRQRVGGRRVRPIREGVEPAVTDAP
ncbi:phosphatase PAP2 family protein, partial [Plantactinospora siamensis]